MIYIDRKKLTVDGVDVYPDHESATQFWYVPGTVRLAQRDKRKALSYLWYTDSSADANGTGFLNFEVNTAVSDDTIRKIRAQIASSWGVKGNFDVAPVPYQGGSVNFSVLGPVAAQAGDLAKDGSVLRQDGKQVVWHAGSSSLVGDNAAVCSVTFTKESMLAAAMKAALQERAQSIAATYRLEFLAMRPSVTFTVKGTFEKTIQDFQASIGAQIPLEAFVLDLGVQAQWQKIMQTNTLNIELVNYSGDDQQDGLKWAQQILLDYVLKNFFEVQLGKADGAWSPLSEAPKVEEAIQKAKEVEQVAGEKVDESGEKDEAKKDETVKEVVKAATSFIPKVNIRAAYYQGRQVNTIDFVYAEKKARLMPVLPQAVIGLDPADKPGDYILQVNRSQDPFGLPYAVPVSLPTPAARDKIGLQTLNVQARYPAGAPAARQSTFNLTLNAGQVTGPNPLPFQYNSRGDAGVDYSADFVFEPGNDWQGDAFEYRLTGTTDKGSITAMPELVVEFLSLQVGLSQDFIWDDADQVVVSLTSDKWKGEKRVVFQKGRPTQQQLRLRCDAKLKDSPVQYTVEIRRANGQVDRRGPLPVQDGQVTVADRFGGHTPVNFRAGFTQGSADVTLTRQDGDFMWEDQFTLEAGEKVQRIVPSLQRPRTPSELELQYSVEFDSGGSLSGTIKGGASKVLKPGA